MLRLIPVTLDIEDGIDAISDAVNALAYMSLGQMRRAAASGHPLPPLYGGTIRYVRERPLMERWQTALRVAMRGKGDCEDLAAYRVAELNLQGQKASAFASQVTPILVHIRVRLADGTIEDPSAKLGMKGAG